MKWYETVKDYSRVKVIKFQPKKLQRKSICH